MIIRRRRRQSWSIFTRTIIAAAIVDTLVVVVSFFPMIFNTLTFATTIGMFHHSFFNGFLAKMSCHVLIVINIITSINIVTLVSSIFKFIQISRWWIHLLLFLPEIGLLLVLFIIKFMQKSPPLPHLIVPFSLGHQFIFVRCNWMLVVSLTLLSISFLHWSEIFLVLSCVLAKINLLLTLFKSMIVVFFLLLLGWKWWKGRLLMLKNLLLRLLQFWLLMRVWVEHIQWSRVEYGDLLVLLATWVKTPSIICLIFIHIRIIHHHHSRHLVLWVLNLWHIVEISILYTWIPKS